MDYGISSLTASVDYLTVTTKTSDHTANLIALLFNIFGEIGLYGGGAKPWIFKGYRGYTLDGIAYGTRQEEGILMLHGGPAAAHWRKFALIRDTCTRLDLAVTVTLSTMQEAIAKNVYSDVAEKGGRSATLIENLRGGRTAYVGSRTSRYFGRVYDKSAERGEHAGWRWRYEVEIKKPAADLELARLEKTGLEADFINSFVFAWFTARGVKLPWTSSNGESAIEIPKSIQTHEKSIEWLRSQVSPTVHRLKLAGREREAREALGLQQLSIIWIENEQELNKWQSATFSE